MNKPDREYIVAVFPRRSPKGYRFTAYLRDYNPSWSGCNLVSVTAASGREAKRAAIQRVRTTLELGSDEERQSIHISDS